ncbi:MAG: hypothetical protein Q9219_001655 [cf. Caloplaca sp. 3 TL-2023]
MATTASYFDRKPTVSSRPGLSHLQGDPSSPHTPQRTFSSAFSSPSLSYRVEEDTVVLELGARHLSAGIAGESNPRCTLGFGPGQSRRVGDYRQYLPDYQDRPRKRRRKYQWGEDHELWRMDLRDVDLDLVEDRVERAVKEAYTRYLLLDSKNKRMVLVLPSLMPHRLLSSILSCIFTNFQTLSITLFPSPVLNVAAAGCRAGLVVDIGWDETVITSVYDHREVQVFRTNRAMKLVTRQMATILQEYERPDGRGQHSRDQPRTDEGSAPEQPLADSRVFNFAEEVTSRIAWCPMQGQISPQPAEGTEPDRITHRRDPTENDISEPSETTQEHTMTSIPSPVPPRKILQIPFLKLAQPVEDGLLAKGMNLHDLDDNEQPLHHLIYKTLLSLPPDVRSQCIAHIIITGGGSNIAGIKTRLLNELRAVLEKRGWDPVYGKVADETRKHLAETRQTRQDTNLQLKPTSDAHLQPQVEDEMTEKLEEEKHKVWKPMVAGEVRGVETLGAWAGGSLVASLKVKGVVEIERDTFLANGLAGAKKASEIVHSAQRMSLGARSALGERSGWTLGVWT